MNYFTRTTGGFLYRCEVRYWYSCCSYKAVNPYWQSWVKPKPRKA